jgi:hypothetical protein
LFGHRQCLCGKLFGLIEQHTPFNQLSSDLIADHLPDEFGSCVDGLLSVQQNVLFLFRRVLYQCAHQGRMRTVEHLAFREVGQELL